MQWLLTLFTIEDVFEDAAQVIQDCRSTKFKEVRDLSLMTRGKSETFFHPKSFTSFFDFLYIYILSFDRNRC